MAAKMADIVAHRCLGNSVALLYSEARLVCVRSLEIAWEAKNMEVRNCFITASFLTFLKSVDCSCWAFFDWVQCEFWPDRFSLYRFVDRQESYALRSNFRIPRNSFTCHWIRIASIVLCLDLQSLPTGGPKLRGILKFSPHYFHCRVGVNLVPRFFNSICFGRSVWNWNHFEKYQILLQGFNYVVRESFFWSA